MRTAAIPTWCEDVIGLPFELGSNGPNTFDCWGIVRWGMWHGFGVGLPSLDGLRDGVAEEQLAGGLEAAAGAWSRVELGNARPGDVLQLKGRGVGLHVALVVHDGWMLHVVSGGAVRLDRYWRAPWSGRIEACFRHREVSR